MKKHKITVVITQTAPGEAYVATYPAFPGWATQGDTVEDALRMAKEYVELQLEEGKADDLEMLEYARAVFTAVGGCGDGGGGLARNTRDSHNGGCHLNVHKERMPHIGTTMGTLFQDSQGHRDGGQP